MGYPRSRQGEPAKCEGDGEILANLFDGGVRDSGKDIAAASLDSQVIGPM